MKAELEKELGKYYTTHYYPQVLKFLPLVILIVIALTVTCVIILPEHIEQVMHRNISTMVSLIIGIVISIFILILVLLKASKQIKFRNSERQIIFETALKTIADGHFLSK